MSVPFSSKQQKRSSSLSKTKGHCCYTRSKRLQEAFNFHNRGRRQMHLECKNPLASQILAGTNSAPSLSDRGSSNASMSCVGAGASSSRPVLSCMRRTQLLCSNPPKAPLSQASGSKVSKQHERSAPLRDLKMSLDDAVHVI